MGLDKDLAGKEEFAMKSGCDGTKKNTKPYQYVGRENRMKNVAKAYGRYGKRSLLTSTACVAGLAAALAAGTPSAVLAQDDSSDDDVIVVTGSRLARSDLSAPSPTVVVGSDAVQSSGDVTIEALLYEYPQLAAGTTSQVNAAGGQGILTANLRALGDSRTLVLVNGRRFAPAGSAGLVDLSTIPRALVERVEIITGGASAVYGSDAVAGAVNFILKDNFEGVEASYQYGQAFEGDGGSHTAELTVGGEFADGRGHALVYGSYTNRDPVFMADREFSEISVNIGSDGELIPFGSGNIPGTRIGLGASQLAGLNGVNLTPAGECGVVQGVRFGEGGVVLPYCNPQDGYNFSTLNYLIRPLEREQISGLASYEISNDVEMYLETHYINTRNAFQQAEESFGLRTPGLTDQFGNSINGILIPNYATNPVLSAPVQQFLIDNPQLFDIGGARYAGNGIIPNMGAAGDAIIEGTGRRGDETGPRHYDFERDSFAATLGLRGEIESIGSGWTWDVFGQYFRTRTDSVTEGQYSQTRLTLGLDAVDDGMGGAVCRTQILGCVPVNPFGLGSITPEAGAFIAAQRSYRERFERQVVGGSVTGDLFELPAGAVQLAAGFEYRHDDYNFTPGATDLGGEYGTGSQSVTEGDFSLYEFFGETRIPVFKDAPLINEFTIEGAFRYSHYSNFGSANTWKVGSEWAPVDFIRFRAAYNRAFRAPTIGELFAPITEGFTAGDDPCDVTFSPSAAVQAFCVQQGVPQADIATFNQINTGFTAQGGGNPNVGPEKSKTLTVGAVIQPPFLEGFHLTADYYNIRIEDGIASINGGTTVRTCFELLDLSHPTCQAITRSPGNGQISLVRTQLDNQAQIQVRGVDVQADYTFALPGSLAVADGGADIVLTALAGWLFERETIVPGAQPIDCAGYFAGGCTGQTTFGVPDFKANFGVQYNSGPLSFRTGLRLIGNMDPFPTVTTPLGGTGMKRYVDISANVTLQENVSLFGGIDNLFDTQPPVLGFPFGGDANTDVSIWDSIGRRFFLGVRAKF
jgi:outer membrane receptor protein involved in Fe transport